MVLFSKKSSRAFQRIIIYVSLSINVSFLTVLNPSSQGIITDATRKALSRSSGDNAFYDFEIKRINCLSRLLLGSK
ncbi:MAG: hypothetical protein A2099_04160 [Planctomycetes bacterium GWF2_39_10]|nr:MAG: hypothetical protein A2099_04160 [Planctomycetes bacterium GWF2_39_10]